MAEKISSESPSAAHHEKATLDTKSEPELTDATARRQSVALNIVHNPLRVSIGASRTCNVIINESLN